MEVMEALNRLPGQDDYSKTAADEKKTHNAAR
jgi:hypothetical protein